MILQILLPFFKIVLAILFSLLIHFRFSLFKSIENSAGILIDIVLHLQINFGRGNLCRYYVEFFNP